MVLINYKILNFVKSNLHPNIRFTIEMEVQRKLPFLDVLVYQKSNGSLGQAIYRKGTHTDMYSI